MGGGGGKSASPRAAAAPVAAEAPKPYQQEQTMDDKSQNARDAQLKKAMAALGQEGSVKTSPFGSQDQQEQDKQKKLLGA